MGKRKDHVCHRCGKCCIDNGTIWVHSTHPVIEAMVKAVTSRTADGFFRDGGPCDMLIMNENGQAVCLIQKWLGHKHKPDSCQGYPFDDMGDDKRCHYEIAEDNAKMFGEPETETGPSFSVAGQVEDKE